MPLYDLGGYGNYLFEDFAFDECNFVKLFYLDILCTLIYLDNLYISNFLL